MFSLPAAVPKMPAVQPQAAGPGGAQRATFRPPWVKDAPPAMPMPSSAPWMRSRELRASRDEGQTTAGKTNINGLIFDSKIILHWFIHMSKGWQPKGVKH